MGKSILPVKRYTLVERILLMLNLRNIEIESEAAYEQWGHNTNGLVLDTDWQFVLWFVTLFYIKFWNKIWAIWLLGLTKQSRDRPPDSIVSSILASFICLSFNLEDPHSWKPSWLRRNWLLHNTSQENTCNVEKRRKERKKYSDIALWKKIPPEASLISFCIDYLLLSMVSAFKCNLHKTFTSDVENYFFLCEWLSAGYCF